MFKIRIKICSVCAVFAPVGGRIFKPHDDLNYAPPTGATEKRRTVKRRDEPLRYNLCPLQGQFTVNIADAKIIPHSANISKAQVFNVSQRNTRFLPVANNIFRKPRYCCPAVHEKATARSTRSYRTPCGGFFCVLLCGCGLPRLLAGYTKLMMPGAVLPCSSVSFSSFPPLAWLRMSSSIWRVRL